MKKVILILLAVLTLCFNSFSQEIDNVLIVEGKGLVKIEPEIVKFLINFESNDTNYSRCVENSLLKIKNAKDLFEKTGVPRNELKSLNYSVKKDYKYNSQTKQKDFIGYKTNAPLVIEIKLNKPYVDKVFEIVNKKIQTSYTLSFELSSNQLDSARNELIELAVLDAKEKAKSICRETNISLGKVLKVQYGEPKIISNFIRPGYELMHERNSKILLRGTSSTLNTLTPKNIELKTHIVIGWEINSY